VRITILDDDKPGHLIFENPRVRQAVNQNQCIVTVKRIEGSDGVVTVKYKTINYESGVRSAVAGEDYVHVEDTLVFEPNQTSAEIFVEIIPRELKDGEDYDGIFGLQLSDVSKGAKLSARDVCLIELVKDAKSARQAEALNSLFKRIES